eukprot:TRINITY_DN774_c4_g1_i1.p1 TRINITY_DN774_c4_g1~~TRINITY_DN774_c4_g1_i1.p1  ORF type:complete len:1158 (+),score=612.16 TRINITY_DN774_c4_g1_i1:71-3544(+)
MSVTELEKTIRNLRKKINGVEELEKKKGKLEAAQREKIRGKPELVAKLEAAKAQLEALKEGGSAAAEVEEAADAAPAAPEPVAAPEPEPEPEAAPATPPRAANGHAPSEQSMSPAASPAANPATEEFDKEIRKIEKKLKDITALKERKKAEEEENGKHTLNADQLKKIKLAHSLQQDLNKLKDQREKVLRGDDGKKKKKKKEKAPEPEPEPEAEEEEGEEDPFKVDRSKLMALYNEFDMANDVKRKINMGKIKKPTPVQLGKAKMADMLQKAIAEEEERIESETKRLRVAAGLPAVPLTPQEQALLDLESAKQKAIAEEDYDEAKRLKQLIERVTDGATLEEAEGAMADEKAAAEKAAAEAEAKRIAEEEAEAARKAEEEAEAERVRLENEAKEAEERKAAEIVRKKEEKERKEKEKAERKQREAEEAEAAKIKAEEERLEAKRLAEEERLRPRTAEEYQGGLTFTSNKNNKSANASPTPEDDEDALPDVEGGMTFEEMMAAAKLKADATAPYSVSFTKAVAPAKRTGTAAPREGILSKQATRRILRDLRDLAECPLYTVKAETQPDDLFVWHANVSPIEGPYAGSIIHFVIYFPQSYPLEPPKVRCCSRIDHDCIENTAQYSGEVCLRVTDSQHGKGGNGWSPSYDARTVLTHLASMFDKDYVRTKKSKKLEADKVSVQNYKCKETSHSLHTPVPAVPCFNGPFEAMPEVLTIEQGAVWCANAKRTGHYWLHNFTESGKHYFRGVLRQRADADEEEHGHWALGWSTDGNVVEFGSDAGGWAYYPRTGEFMHNGEKTETGVTAGAGDIIDCFLDLDEGKVSFTVNGTEISEGMTGISADQMYHPTFSLGKGYGVELLFTPNAVTLPPSALPVASVSSVIDEKPQCIVTKEGTDEQVLGVGLHVSRSDRDVHAITADEEIISQEAFGNNVRKSARNGSHLTNFFPLLLGPHHSAKARPVLERTIAETLRNPRAALPKCYTPPFKPANVNIVMPKILAGIVDTFLEAVKNGAVSNYNVHRTVRLYSHMQHAYKALIAAHSSIVDDADKRVADDDCLAAGPNLLALPASQSTGSHLLDLVRDAGDYAGGAKEEIQKVVLMEALKNLFADTTLGEFHSSHGEPSPEQVASFRKTVDALQEATDVKEALAAGGVPEELISEL